MAKDMTLVIDGNFFVYSRLYVMPSKKGFKVDGELIKPKRIDTDQEKQKFMEKLAMDFAHEIRKFSDLVTRIVFVADSGSWRKKKFPNAKYKGNRIPKDDVNWQNVYGVMNDFTDILQDKGIIIEKVDNAEGDDLMFAWSVLLNSKEENIILWTGDKDLLQLVNYNTSTNAWTLWYDSTRTMLGVYPGFERWLNTADETKEIDIFNLDSVDIDGSNEKSAFKYLIDKFHIKLEKIFCDEFALIKILIGDKSDNISSVVTKPSKNGKREFKISEKKAYLILEKFKAKFKNYNSLYLFDKYFQDNLVKIIKEVMNVDTDDKIVCDKLELNTNLILLNTHTIPKDLQDNMFNLINEDLKQHINNYRVLTSNYLILEGSSYAIKNKTYKPKDTVNYNKIF